MEKIDIKEACSILNVSQRTLYRWISDGKMSATKVGRGYRFDKSRLLEVAGLPNPKTSTFAQLYREDCRFFLVDLIEEIKPDFIFTETRIGERVITAYQLLPPTFPNEKIFAISSLMHRSSKRLRDLISGKMVLLLDEAAARGISLAEHRALLEAQGAIVVTAVLAIREGGLDDRRIQEFPIRYALKLNDYEYRRFTSTLLDALAVSGVSLDLDHLSFMLNIRDLDLVDDLMAQTALLGRIHNTRSYVGQYDDNNEFVMRGWTLDDPDFIRIPKGFSDLQPKDAVFKLRFDRQPNGVRCVVIITNQMTIYPNDFSTSLISHFGDMVTILPADWQDMEAEQKSQYLYESNLLILAAEIFRQFTSVAKKGASAELQTALDSAYMEENEICSIFDRSHDNAIISLASEISKGKIYFQPEDYVPVCYSNPIPIIGHSSSVLPLSSNFNKIAIETLKKQIEEQIKSENYISLSQLGLSRDTFATVLQKDYPDVDYVTLSRFLDEMLDQAILKPHIRIEQLKDGSFLCTRVYRLGERSGYKAPIPPTMPDAKGISRDRFERSYSMTQGMRDTERSLVIMEMVTHHIATSLGIHSVPDILINKVLSNMTIDWNPIDKEAWPFTIRNFVFGTMVEASSEPSSIRDRIFLGELTRRSSILNHDYKGKGDYIGDKSLTVSRFPHVSFPFGAVTLEEGFFDDYIAGRIEEYIPKEGYQIRSLTNTYLEILDIDKESLQNPDSLVALAIGRSQRAAYTQLHTQLRLWHEYMESAIHRCMNFIHSLQHGIDINPEKLKEITHKINLAKGCFYQFDIKLDLLRKMPYLLEKIAKNRNIEAINRRRISASAEKLVLDDNNAKFPISSLSFIKETLSSLNGVSVGIIKQIINSKKVAPLPKRWDIERITGVRALVRELRQAISTNQPIKIMRALSTLYMKMRSGFEKMPIPNIAEEDWKTTLQQLYSRIKRILDQNVRGKQLAMAYVDILGFQEITANSVVNGEYTNIEDARRTWWNTVNNAIERVVSANNDAFFNPVGGDGWLLYTASSRDCLELIDSLHEQLYGEEWPLPCIGVGFGAAEPTGAGAYDVEAILAYFISDKMRTFRGIGKILFTESAYQNIITEDKTIDPLFSAVGKIVTPRCGADEVIIYEYDCAKMDA